MGERGGGTFRHTRDILKSAKCASTRMCIWARLLGCAAHVRFRPHFHVRTSARCTAALRSPAFYRLPRASRRCSTRPQLSLSINRRPVNTIRCFRIAASKSLLPNRMIYTLRLTRFCSMSNELPSGCSWTMPLACASCVLPQALASFAWMLDVRGTACSRP